MGMGIDRSPLSTFIDHYAILRNCVNDLNINAPVIMYKLIDHYLIIIKLISCLRCLIFENDVNFL